MLIKRFKDLYKIILAGPQKYNGFLYTIRFSELNRISTDFCIRKITKEDLPKIVKLRDANVAKAFCTMLSKKNDYCVAAFDGEQLVGHAVCSLPKTKVSTFDVHDFAYIHYCYVSPDYRGQNIYPAMLKYIVENIHKNCDMQMFSIATDMNNISSQRGLLKLGFGFDKTYKSYVWWRFSWKRVKVEINKSIYSSV